MMADNLFEEPSEHETQSSSQAHFKTSSACFLVDDGKQS